jgi:hypothetical protein
LVCMIRRSVANSCFLAEWRIFNNYQFALKMLYSNCFIDERVSAIKPRRETLRLLFFNRPLRRVSIDGGFQSRLYGHLIKNFFSCRGRRLIFDTLDNQSASVAGK